MAAVVTTSTNLQLIPLSSSNVLLNSKINQHFTFCLLLLLQTILSCPLPSAQLNITLAYLYKLIGSVIITCYGVPYVVIILAPLTVVYYFIQRLAQGGARGEGGKG